MCVCVHECVCAQTSHLLSHLHAHKIPGLDKKLLYVKIVSTQCEDIYICVHEYTNFSARLCMSDVCT